MYPLHVLFSIGHKLTGIGMYFNQARLLRQLQPYAREDIQELQLSWIEHLKKISPTFATAVLETNEALETMGKSTVSEPPQSPDDFVVWANENHQWLMTQLPEERVSRAIYLYGFALGEMMSTLSLSACVLDITAQYEIPMTEQLQNNRTIVLELLKRWNTLARGCAQIPELSFLCSQFLLISSPIESIFIDPLETKKPVEQSASAQDIRDKIDILGVIETTCRDKLQELDALFPIGDEPSPEAQ